MKIALFGGSFDPPHKGHDAIVKQALRKLDIDKFIIMPTFTNPFKKECIADEKQRLLWVNKLWKNLNKVEICDFEIRQGYAVPSIKSVRYLYELYNPNKLYLLIGADHLEKLHLWHEFKNLTSLVEFIIISRNNIKIPQKFKKLEVDIQTASSSIRYSLNTNEVCEQIKDEVKKYYETLKKG